MKYPPVNERILPLTAFAKVKLMGDLDTVVGVYINSIGGKKRLKSEREKGKGKVEKSTFPWTWGWRDSMRILSDVRL